MTVEMKKFRSPFTNMDLHIYAKVRWSQTIRERRNTPTVQLFSQRTTHFDISRVFSRRDEVAQSDFLQ